VAGFIGISNLMEGRVEAGGVRLTNGTHCTARVPEGVADGTEVHISVRPEKIVLDGSAGGLVQLAGTIAERVYVGTATQVIVELEGGARVVALEQNTERARADDRWELGDRVTVGWLPEHSLVLR
jgi:spermidine/putrescine transport system ATP-binding protein